MIRFLIAAVSINWIFPFYLAGQFYLTGENPASLKWNSLKSNHFKILYPVNLKDEAVKLSSILEFSMDSISDLKRPLKKEFPVIMQNGSMFSNGFVTLAPRRMEVQITPPQDLYAQDWITQLALHEFRHIAQLNKFNQGLTHAFGWLTGEITAGLISSRFPPWFYEGDAVYNETRLSQSGRGRSAGFEMPLRTLLLREDPDDKSYSYDKMMFGSYRDFVPDAYVYGYQITGFLRSQQGVTVWSDALDYVARNPYQILPLAFYLKRNFGFFKQVLYEHAMDSLKSHYNNTIDTVIYSESKLVFPKSRKVHTDYLHPLAWKEYIIAYRTGLDDPGSFVRIDSTGNEKRLFYTGRIVSGDADLHGSSLIWDEISMDPRWEKRNYSVIKSYDMFTHKQKKLTHKTRYFSPDFSPDGNRIAVVENDLDNNNFLTVIDSHNGQVLSKFPSSNALLNPEWSGPNEVVLITVSDSGKQIQSINVITGEWHALTMTTNINIFDPLVYDNFILFRADYHNVENILALDTYSDKIFKITGTNFGARFPSIDKDHNLLISEYDFNGFDISVLKLKPDTWLQINDVFHESEKNPIIPLIPAGNLNFSGYNKFLHIFRFHSWLPFYTDIDELLADPMSIKIDPGLILFSQNLLGSTISSIGYSYRNGFHYFHPSIRMRGWYPVFEWSADIGGPLNTISLPDDIKTTGKIRVHYNFRSFLPLTFSRGPDIIFVRPEVAYEFVPVLYNNGEQLKHGISLINFRFSAASYRRMAVRDLFPDLGQSFVTTFSFQPGQYFYGKLYSFQVNLFFPGITDHHHLFFTAGFQKQVISKYMLPYNRITYPRGFDLSSTGEISSFSVNYAFPLAYPDFSIGPVFYFKRIKSNIFYDWGYGSNMELIEPDIYSLDGNLSSAGFELTTDFHALRFVFPFSAGIRVGYRNRFKNPFAEFLIGVNTNL